MNTGNKFKSIILLMILTLVLVACGPSTGKETDTETGSGEETVRVALLLSGNLGDMSFLDSAKEGTDRILEKYENVTVQVVEMGTDATVFETNVLDFSEDGYDFIIGSGWQLQEPFQNVAPEFPDVKYILFDAAVDYTIDKFENVYSINYKVNEASYLAGVMAANMSETGILGFLGGADGAGINDFLIGYIEGAQSVNPDIKVLVGYVGSFADSPRAKEMALAQYNQGADFVFTAAGASGIGTLEAAKESGNFAIGVDSDQAMLYHDTDPEQANVIPVSVMKNVAESLVRSFELNAEGKLPLGSEEKLGIQENAVGLSDNQYFDALVDDETKALIDDAYDSIVNGSVTVTSAFGLTTQEVSDIVDSVRP